MSEDLLDYEKELVQLIKEIEKNINEISKTKEKDKDEHIGYIKKRISRAKIVLTSFKIEMRQLDQIHLDPYSKKAKEYAVTINKLTNELQHHEDKIDLLKGATETNNGLDGKTTDDILKRAQDTQVESSKVLDRIIVTVEQTMKIGTNTALKLHENTKTLERIDDGVSEVNDNLKLASTALKSFSRRVATDRLFLCFVCLIVVGIIIIIVWSIVNPNANTNVPESFKPATTKIIPTTKKLN